MSEPQIDRYVIKSGLGIGASGKVYRALDPKLGRDVAVKILNETYARDDKHRARFERETRAIATLKHPNIVKIYDHGGSPEQLLYLVMELIDGPHLGKLLRENGPLPETVVLAVGVGFEHNCCGDWICCDSQRNTETSDSWLVDCQCLHPRMDQKRFYYGS